MAIGSVIDGVKTRFWSASVKLDTFLDRSGDPYARKVRALHRRLGISPDYPRRGMPFHHEAADLVPVACGNDSASQPMSLSILANWQAMRSAAVADNVDFFVRFAYRSAREQALLIRRRLIGGHQLEELLSYIAAPGYSEHHTGRALDLACGPSDKDFDKSAAFHWLARNAHRYGFSMSYPADNALGIRYEPWHWFCDPESSTAVRPTLLSCADRGLPASAT